MRYLAFIILLGFVVPAASAQTVDTLIASDGTFDFFGYGVDIDGDVAVAGAPVQNTSTGAAYVFRHDGTRWIEEAKLTASDATMRDQFGYDVAISGDVIAVGASYESERAYQAGAVYVYRHDGTSWVEEQKVLPPEGSSAYTQFGWDVDIQGDRLVGGAVGDGETAAYAGAAYVYRYEDGVWVFEAKLTAADGSASAFLGESVAIQDDLIAVGASGQDDAAGAVYLYRHDGTEWAAEAKLSAADGSAGNHFGSAMDVNEEQWVIAGAWVCQCVEDDVGSAYVYRKTGSGWEEMGKLLASDGDPVHDFAFSVAMSGTVAAVGATKYRPPGSASGNGAVYLFRWEDGAWVEKEILLSPIDQINGEFGFTVAARGNDLVVGSITARPDGATTSGAAFVYTHGLQSVSVDIGAVPEGYRLDQNYPNPFNPRTTIDFTLPAPADVRLTVHDLLGRTVAVLVDGRLAAGDHSTIFEAVDLPSGVYVYHLATNGRSLTRPLVLLK